MSPHTGLARYVSPELLRKLRYAQTHSGAAGLDVDYFMQAQDLDPAFQAKHIPGWPNRIKTSVVSSTNGATVAVLFKGVHFDDRVRVHVARVGGEWRIDSISSANR